MRLNKAVFLHALRGQSDAPLRLALAGLLLLVLYAFVGNGVTVNGTPLSGIHALVNGGNSLLPALLWLFGLGLISRDISSGSIQLVLLRPLSRASYVLSKWAALASFGVAVLLFMHAAYALHHSFSGQNAVELGLLLGAQLVQVAAVAGIIALFSVLPVRFGELGLLSVLGVVLVLLRLMNLRWRLDALDQALAFAWKVLLPGADAPDAPDNALWTGLGLNAAVAVASLAWAVALLRRREFSYAESA